MNGDRVNSMSEIDRLVNSCLMPGFAGPVVPEWVEEALDNGLAGICVYGQNLPGPGDSEMAADRVRDLSAAVQKVRPDALVALDEEGGDVTRLDYRLGSRYPGNLALGTVDDESLTRAVASAIGRDLRRAGVNVNFAPSVDVNSDIRNPVIGVRSFGADPRSVARHAAAFVDGLQAAGVAATAKHFPGHGATTVDSHLGLPVIDADEATFRRRDLPPFAAAVEAGVELVMTSHVVFTALDDAPATLSRRLLQDLLRSELGFDGVVVTDALDMAGVRAAHGIPVAAALAMAAGADLLLIGAEDGEEHCAAIRAAIARHVDDGRLTEERLREAAGRMAALRERLAGRSAAAPDDDGDDLGLVAARSALRTRDVAALDAAPVVVELRAGTNLAVGGAKWSLAEPLQAQRPLSDVLTVTADGPSADEAVARADGAPLVVAVRDAYRSEWQRAWLRRLTEQRPDAVVVALGMPADLDLVPGPAVAAHGAARANTRAVADLLAGR
jgi:beta-N-acetylhexosaminidase